MIAPKLRLLLNTKKDLQAILKVPNGVPFNQYVRYLAWVGEPIPKAHLFGDYVKGRFTAGGKAVLQDEVGEFTRLSKATNFVGGELVEYEVGQQRIEAGKGLLIEPQRTNRVSWSENISNWSLQGSGGLVFSEETPSPRLGSMADRVVLSDTSTTLAGRVHPQGANPNSFSVFLKHADTQYVRVRCHTGGSYTFDSVVDVVNGEIVLKSGNQAATATAWYCLKLPNGWVKLVLEAPYVSIYNHYVDTVDGGYIKAMGSFYIWGFQFENEALTTSSYISTHGTPATRSPDLLRIPLLPNQSITIDADEGLRCVKDGASALISADTPAYLRTFAVDEAKVAFNNYATGVYKVDDMEVSFEQLNEFTRLTAATNFVGGELVEYAANKPRIETGKGLLIEPSATELFKDNSNLISTSSSWTHVQEIDDSKHLTAFTSAAISAEIDVSVSKYTNGNTLPSSGSYSRAILVKKTNDDAYFALGSATGNSHVILNTKTGAWYYIGSAAIGSVVDYGSYWRVQGIAVSTGAVGNQFRVYASTSLLSVSTLAIPLEGFKVVIGYASMQDSTVTSSIIKTGSNPSTRSPDLLRLTIPAGKTLTLDADAGISYIMENATTALITATKPAYIRSARIA